jgi:hypothetical protein
MVYTFARVSAVIRMKVSDYFVQGRRAAGYGSTKKAARNMKCPATMSIFLDRKNLQESGGEMPLFPYIVRNVDRKTPETLGFRLDKSGRTVRLIPAI